jgi:hypothetical protein
LILAYQGLEEENLDQKSSGLPGWGLVQQASPLLIGKRNLLKSPLEMEEGRLPKEVMKWRPKGRRKRGRPKLTWAEGIRKLMGEKGLMEEDWNDRSKWRKKII